MGCRRRAPQPELVRLVADAAGRVLVGRTLPGRGAWLCAGSPDCLALAVRRHAISRALRVPVSPEAVERLAGSIGG